MTHLLSRTTRILALSCVLAGVFTAGAQNGPRANRQLPQETVGIDAIVEALISAFDRVLAIADTHQRKFDSDLRIRLVRHPAFAGKARFIVVEFANTADQATLDRYVNGEKVSLKRASAGLEEHMLPANVGLRRLL